jgi:hypothetical protein
MNWSKCSSYIASNWLPCHECYVAFLLEVKLHFRASTSQSIKLHTTCQATGLRLRPYYLRRVSTEDYLELLRLELNEPPSQWLLQSIQIGTQTKLAIFDAHIFNTFPSRLPLHLHLQGSLLLQLPEPLQEFLERRAELWVTVHIKMISWCLAGVSLSIVQ